MANRWRMGAAAWVASALLIPVQILVALQWPLGYSLSRNAISDLGVTACGPFSERGGLVREICSPWHAVFNVGMIASGALIAIGALLLYGRWGGRAGRIGTVLMAVGGIAVMAVGLAPWNVHPYLHDSAALVQAAVQWLAMVLIGMAAGSGRFRVLTIAAVAISMIGFIAFLAALEGAAMPGLSFGISERLSFDTLTLWTALTGLAVLFNESSRSSWRVRQEAA